MDSRKQKPSPVVMAGPPPPPSFIKTTSPFRLTEHQCCQCAQTTPEQHLHQQPQQHQQHPQLTRRCSQTTCEHDLCSACNRLDARGYPVIPHAFPAGWVCSTCTAAHSVLDILTQDVACACGNPTLQAVYDQFGRIFLFWRDDPAVYDLTDPAKVQEAAWRVWEAGGEPWLEDVLEWERRKAKGAKGWNRMSQSSLSSEESIDVVME